MQTLRTEAIILRRTNYGEADRILNIITPDHGKLSAIAKAVRKPKSKLAGGLELLAVSDITIMQGRSDMGVVTSARIKEFYGNILHDYDRMQFAYESIKESNRATQTVSEPDFYYLLRDTLSCLNNLDISWQLVEVCFRLRLATLLGHGLNLATDNTGAKLAADKTYQYDFADNAFYADTPGRFTGDHIKLLRLAAVKSPGVLRQVAGVEAVMNDCLWLVRTISA